MIIGIIVLLCICILVLSCLLYREHVQKRQFLRMANSANVQNYSLLSHDANQIRLNLEWNKNVDLIMEELSDFFDEAEIPWNYLEILKPALLSEWKAAHKEWLVSNPDFPLLNYQIWVNEYCAAIEDNLSDPEHCEAAAAHAITSDPEHCEAAAAHAITLTQTITEAYYTLISKGFSGTGADTEALLAYIDVLYGETIGACSYKEIPKVIVQPYKSGQKYVCFVLDRSEIEFEEVDKVYAAGKAYTYYVTDHDILLSIMDYAGINECSGMYLDAFIPKVRKVMDASSINE